MMLSGHHALITGAGSGIGAAVATTLARAGARVTLAGRRLAPLQETAALCGAGNHFIADAFDVTDSAAVARGIDAARNVFGPVSILVNNAGEAPSASFEKTDAALWERVISVDLTGVYRVTHALLADIRSHGSRGRIISIASTAGLKGYGYVSAYCAAKHGVIGLTRALAVEYAKTGMTVNAVCPGFTETPLIAAAVDTIVRRTGRSADEARAELARANPQGRLIQPQEVADAVLWLASGGAQSINGQTIAVAGGEIMG
ncbi:MAG: SDR family NAD(P)-dependent oxidoreductase [Beijerinckiaceae bacterium]